MQLAGKFKKSPAFKKLKDIDILKFLKQTRGIHVI